MGLDFIKNNKKTSAAIAAAAVLGASVATYFGVSDGEPEIDDIDWSIVILDIPKLDIPKIDVPTIDGATLPSVALDVPKIDIEAGGVVAPSVDAPTVVTPSVGDASLDMPSVETPDIVNGENVKAEYGFSVEDIKQLVGLDVPFFEYLIVNGIIQLDVDKIDMNPYDLKDWVAFRKAIKDMFADKRMMERDGSMNINNKDLVDWIIIYKEHQNDKPIEYVEVEPFTMITEVRPMTKVSHKAKLDANLDFYKSAGYDSVLVTFFPEDDPGAIINTIKYIKANYGMKVWLAYSGIESLTTSVFCSVLKYTEILEACAPVIDGYFNSWRRTSGHLWEQDAAFKNYTNSVLRKANPKLPIMGELYFGNYWKHDGERDLGFVENRSANESAVCVMNFGYSNINVKRVVDNVIKKYIKSTPLVGCVVGHRAYYGTRNKNGLSAADNIFAKRDIEASFRNAGFIGTVTYQDDGSSQTTNNLCETLYNEVTGE